jgi:tetratricopeptide (TPR) repeat protein
MLNRNELVMVKFTTFVVLMCLPIITFSFDQTHENEKTVLKTTLSYLMGHQKYSESLDYTKKFLKKYSTDAEGWHLEGLVYYAKGDFKKSEEDFLKASKIYPVESEERAVDLYLASQTAIKTGNLASAEKHLLEMAKNPTAQAYSRSALTQLSTSKSIPEFNLTMLENKSEENVSNESTGKSKKKTAKAKTEDKKATSMSLELVGGLDTNPIFLPDNSQSKNEAKSIFSSQTLGITHASTLKGGEFNNSFSLGHTGYQKDAAKSFDNLRVSLATNWKPVNEFFQKNQLTLTNKIDQSYGTNNTIEYFYTSETLGIKKDYLPIGDHKFTSGVTGSYRFYANKNLDVKENDRSGATVGLSGGHKLTRDNWVWMNNISFTQLFTVGEKFNTREFSLVTNYQKIIWWQIELFLGANTSLVSYPNNGSRMDKSYGAEVDLSRDVNSINGLNLKVSASRTQNKSEATDSNYTQDIFALWVTYDLF